MTMAPKKKATVKTPIKSVRRSISDSPSPSKATRNAAQALTRISFKSKRETISKSKKKTKSVVSKSKSKKKKSATKTVMIVKKKTSSSSSRQRIRNRKQSRNSSISEASDLSTNKDIDLDLLPKVVVKNREYVCPPSCACPKDVLYYVCRYCGYRSFKSLANLKEHRKACSQRGLNDFAKKERELKDLRNGSDDSSEAFIVPPLPVDMDVIDDNDVDNNNEDDNVMSDGESSNASTVFVNVKVSKRKASTTTKSVSISNELD